MTNDKGKRIAVLIDLRKYVELWEDLYDSFTARRHAREPRESLDSVKKRLHMRAKLGC